MISISYNDRKNRRQFKQFFNEKEYYSWRAQNVGLPVMSISGLF
jgi:hypothetical protein